MRNSLKPLLLTILIFAANFVANAQTVGLPRLKRTVSEEALVDYTSPKDYIIGGITVSGAKFLDPNTLISVSGLNVNDEINLCDSIQ